MSPIQTLTLILSIAVFAEAFVIDDDALLLQSDMLVRPSSESAPLLALRRIRRIGTITISPEADILEVCTFVASFLFMTTCLLVFVRWASHVRDIGKHEVPVKPAVTFAQFLEAIEIGDLERSQALLRSNPGFVFRCDGAGNTALHVAAANGASDIMKFCLQQKGDIDARNLACETPLHAAAVAGELCCLLALADAGADLEAEDAQGATPVLAAAKAQQRSVCQLLLDHGASPEVPDPPALLEELLDELYHVPLHKTRSQSSISTTDGDSLASNSPTMSSSSSLSSEPSFGYPSPDVSEDEF